MYKEIEAKRLSRHEHIKKVANTVQLIEGAVHSNEEDDDLSVDEENLEEEEKRALGPPRKTKMCQNFVKYGRCEDGKACKFAHYGHELSLNKLKDKIKNLKTFVVKEKKAM